MEQPWVTVLVTLLPNIFDLILDLILLRKKKKKLMVYVFYFISICHNVLNMIQTEVYKE